MIVGMAVCGAIVYAGVIPAFGDSLRAAYPEFSNRYWPWLFFLWATGIPCAAVLVIGWNIAEGIGRDQSFTLDNARRLEWIARLAVADAGAVLLGNVAYLLLDLSHPGVLLLSLLVVFVGMAVAVIAYALSRLVRKAAGLQEQSDLTI